jgi:glycosyltransferase involved in cell wall biosynthesis
MHTFLTVLLGIVAGLWVLQALRAALGMPRLPQIKDAVPLADAECPAVSVIFAARDEEEKMPRALETMLAQDYPRYEVVAVNDRSRDATGRIIAEAAAQNSHLKPVQIEELPPGWLGKPHALQRGADLSSGEWLLFTDGDVRFAPDLVRRAISVATQKGWDHFTLLGWLDLEGFWEKTALMYFGVAFTFGFEPWKVSDPKSKKFMGVGSFQLVRRAAYEASGGHRRLAMEVIDDMKLGKIIKQAGFRSGVGIGAEYVTLRWHAGLGNIVRGVTKNFFAGADYSLARAIWQVLAIMAFSVLPFVALFLATGWARIFAGVAAAVAVAVEATAAFSVRVFPLYGLTHPLGGLIFCWMVIRSTAVTLWQGGVTWRGTFYPLEELRKGIV